MALSYKSAASLAVNFLFVVGVLLTVTGLIRSVQFLANLMIFDEYPLAYEENCALQLPRVTDEKYAPSPEQFREDEAACRSRLSHQRRYRQVQDATFSFGFLLTGALLTFLFNPKGMFTSSLS